MNVKAIIGEAIPLPWRPQRIYDEKGWGHEVLSADGQAHDRYKVTKEEGALLAAVQAIAPEAVDYVLRAAEKGGAEAVALAQRFHRSIVHIEAQQTPEQKAKRRP